MNSEGRKVTLFVDEYGAGLDQQFFIGAAIGVRGEAALESASAGFESLCAKESLFTHKGRKWGPNQYQSFADYLLRWDLLPTASYVRIDAEFVGRLRQASRDLIPMRIRAGIEPQPDLPMKPIHWLMGQVLSRVMAFGTMGILVRFGPIRAIELIVHRGNLKESHERVLRESLGQCDGDFSYGVILRAHRTAPHVVPASQLPRLRDACRWSGPTIRFARRHPLLSVADGYVALVSKARSGDAAASDALESLRATYAYRHQPFDAGFLLVDESESVHRALDGVWDRLS